MPQITNNVKSVEQFTQQYPGNGGGGVCDVTLVELLDGRAVVIASEQAGNHGMSVTNAAEQIATLVCGRRHLDPRQLVYIEHYPQHADGDPVPSWDIVTFKLRAGDFSFSEPDWRPARRDDFAELGIADPRRWALDVDVLDEADGGGMFWRVTSTPPGTQPGEPPRLVSWFCDRPEAHGADAGNLAHRFLSALYRGRINGPHDLHVGQLVAFAFRPMVMRPEGTERCPLALGRGVVEEIRTEPGLGNPYRVRLDVGSIPVSLRPVGPQIVLGFGREQLADGIVEAVKSPPPLSGGV